MAGNFGQVYNRLFETIEVNFKKPSEIAGTIERIDLEKKIFVVKSEDGSKTMECLTTEPLSDYKEGDKIYVKGFIKLWPGSLSRLYLKVEYMCIQNEEEQYKKAIDVYNRLFRTLMSDKYKPMVNKLASKSPPMIIMNIGLVVPPNNDQNLEDFKINFREKCSGKLFIYRLDEEKIEKSLHLVLEYFKKYHQIDIICLLTNNLSTKYVCQLSSKMNVISMLHRKKCPYVVSIMNISGKNMLMPLTSILSNKYDNMLNFINFIHDNQMLWRNILQKAIQDGKNRLLEIIEERRQKLLNIRLDISGMVDHRMAMSSTSLDRLKGILTNAILMEKLQLKEYQINICNNIIDDKRIVATLSKIIEDEKNLLHEKKSFNIDNGQNRTITKGVEIIEEDKKIENKNVDNSLYDNNH